MRRWCGAVLFAMTSMASIAVAQDSGVPEEVETGKKEDAGGQSEGRATQRLDFGIELPEFDDAGDADAEDGATTRYFDAVERAIGDQDG